MSLLYQSLSYLPFSLSHHRFGLFFSLFFVFFKSQPGEAIVSELVPVRCVYCTLFDIALGSTGQHWRVGGWAGSGCGTLTVSSLTVYLPRSGSGRQGAPEGRQQLTSVPFALRASWIHAAISDCSVCPLVRFFICPRLCPAHLAPNVENCEKLA